MGNSAHIQRPLEQRRTSGGKTSVGRIFLLAAAGERRSLEQRRTSGGKGTEYRLPKCGNAFSNHNYFPRRCNAELAPPASPGKKCWHVRRSNELGGEFGITPRRLRVSLPAPSPGVLKVEFPCLSSAGPPLLLLGICVSYYLSGGAVFSFGIQ